MTALLSLRTAGPRVGRPRVNRAHPAAAYLTGRGAGVFVFDGVKVFDLLGNYGGSSISAGTPSLKQTQFGPYLDFNSAGIQLGSAPSGATTIIILGMRSGNVGTNSPGFVQAMLTTVDIGAGARSGITIEYGNNFAAIPADVPKLYIDNYVSGSTVTPDNIWVNGGRQLSTPSSDAPFVNGVWYCVGVTVSSLAVGNSTLRFGKDASGSIGMTGGGPALCYIFAGVLPDQLMERLTSDPFALLVWPDDEPRDELLAGVGIALPEITGALEATLDGAGLAATARVRIAATLSAALADVTLSATGAARVAGQVAATLEGAGISAAGVVAIAGQIAATLDGVALAGTGRVAIRGSLAATLDGASLVASAGNPVPPGRVFTVAAALRQVAASAGPRIVSPAAPGRIFTA